MLPKPSSYRLEKPKYTALCRGVMDRDGWKCRCCKRRGPLHAHHIIFRSHGGDDVTWNLITVCDECHDALHFKTKIAGQGLIINPGSPFEDSVDANGKVRWQFVNGWQPSAHASLCGGQSQSYSRWQRSFLP
jgi:hypothetical protein